MAVKWYLLPKDTSWENYWEDISIEEQAKTTENDCPELLEAILKYSNNIIDPNTNPCPNLTDVLPVKHDTMTNTGHGLDHTGLEHPKK